MEAQNLNEVNRRRQIEEQEVEAVRTHLEDEILKLIALRQAKRPRRTLVDAQGAVVAKLADDIFEKLDAARKRSILLWEFFYEGTADPADRAWYLWDEWKFVLQLIYRVELERLKE